MAVRNESIEGRQRTKYKMKVDSIEHAYDLKLESINERMIADVLNDPENEVSITSAYTRAKEIMEE